MSSNWHRIRIPGFIPPGFIQSLNGSDGTVMEDGIVDPEGSDMTVGLEDPTSIEPGTEVEFRIRSGNLFCRSKEDVWAAKRSVIHGSARRELDQQEEKDRRRAEAEAFWDQYEIPFDYDVVYKGRRSGLSKGSWGDGRDSNTVEHLFVLEAFDAGRLSRESEVYLCDDSATLRYTDGIRGQDGSGNEYIPKVTCQTCLQRMKRWKEEK
jgi:hypothetical protein